MTDTIYVGLDLSLTGAGVAVLAPGEELRTATVKSDPKKYGPSVTERRRRLAEHSAAILDTGLGPPNSPLRRGAFALHFIVEAPSFASQNGSQHERAGLWWMTVDECCVIGRVTEVPPTVVKKFATGKGNSDKDAMAWVTAREFPHIHETLNNNEVDALWLATIGKYHADPEIAGVPATGYRNAAVKAIAWT